MFTLNCTGKLLIIREPLVMAIINATPDSFFTGSRHQSVESMLRSAETAVARGASILDIGGQSTRPGAASVPVDEELQRVIDGVAAIAGEFPEIPISIDTYYARVASEAVAAGASIVNDVSAGSLDQEMIRTVASLRVPYVLMHGRGDALTMSGLTEYDHLETDVLDFFIAPIRALRDAGITDLIIDPGFGFAKTIAQNFQLLRNLRMLEMLGCPVLAGLSRKGTVYKTLGITADEALNGSTVLHTMALLNGASILRVHDVREAVEAVKLYTAYGGIAE